MTLSKSNLTKINSAYDAKVFARHPKSVVLQIKANQDQLVHSNELAVQIAIENIESDDTEADLVQLNTAASLSRNE